MKISRNEYQILFLFAFAISLQFLLNPFTWLELGVLYAMGMAFEFLTQDAWDYNPDLKDSTFTYPGKDVNFIFGLGWVSVVLTGYTIGTMFPFGEFWSLVAGIFITGNILERLFLALGLWTYNEEHWSVTLWTGKPIMTDIGIPVSVTQGYINIGCLAALIVKYV